LALEKGVGVDIRVEYERARSLSLGVCLQINHANGMGAGLASLQFGSVGFRLLHRVAMCHQVSRGTRHLVLHTLRPTYGGRSLRHQQHQQQQWQNDFAARARW
jgi:hypothetical protein